MPYFDHHGRELRLRRPSGIGSYISYGSLEHAIIRPTPVIVEPIQVIQPVHYRPSTESDEEYARRKDRKYALSADELKNLKKQRNKVKEWLEGARSWDDSKQWKKQYEELKDRVNWMQKKVDEERSAVLRRYRL